MTKFKFGNKKKFVNEGAAELMDLIRELTKGINKNEKLKTRSLRVVPNVELTISQDAVNEVAKYIEEESEYTVSPSTVDNFRIMIPHAQK